MEWLLGRDFAICFAPIESLATRHDCNCMVVSNGSNGPGARCVLAKMAIVVSIQNGAVGIAAAFWFQPVVAETAVM